MSDDVRARVVAEFRARFGAAPAFVARAPGRVNLIGDHTDYNDGFVLPMAIHRAVWIAFRARPDGDVIVHSLDFGDVARFDLGNEPAHATGWQEYLRGVAWALRDAGHTLRGWEGVVAGDVPLGAGLSSSAALELAVARVFTSTSHLEWDAASMALLAQRAENRWVGMNCGIMDQLISAAGVDRSALLIDCRTLATHAVALPAGVAVVVLDTGTRRGLVDSEYNERRERCEAAARFFGVAALRDVDEAMFRERSAELDDITRRRARHVIGENRRTQEAAAALERDDVQTVGRLMDESHASLRDDFAVSRPELDVMVTIAREQAACLGARMTGAGFGGCAVALVRREGAESFARETAARYQRAAGIAPAVYVCTASAGASVAPA